MCTDKPHAMVMTVALTDKQPHTHIARARPTPSNRFRGS